jgi:hypothetical protein
MPGASATGARRTVLMRCINLARACRLLIFVKRRAGGAADTVFSDITGSEDIVAMHHESM